jgi:hypothetical protein
LSMEDLCICDHWEKGFSKEEGDKDEKNK